MLACSRRVGGGESVFLLHVCTRARRETCVLFPFSSVKVVRKWKYGGNAAVSILVRLLMGGSQRWRVVFISRFALKTGFVAF